MAHTLDSSDYNRHSIALDSPGQQWGGTRRPLQAVSFLSLLLSLSDPSPERTCHTFHEPTLSTSNWTKERDALCSRARWIFLAGDIPVLIPAPRCAPFTFLGSRSTKKSRSVFRKKKKEKKRKERKVRSDREEREGESSRREERIKNKEWVVEGKTKTTTRKLWRIPFPLISRTRGPFARRPKD